VIAETYGLSPKPNNSPGPPPLALDQQPEAGCCARLRQGLVLSTPRSPIGAQLTDSLCGRLVVTR